MPNDRETRIEDLFHLALELDPCQRREFVTASCQDDVTIASRVFALLEAYELADRSFDALETQEPDTASTWVGSTLDGYRIVKVAGTGGMGTVFEAEQIHPRRRVALKVMHVGVVSTNAWKRFERESHVLARLEHPGIARVYGAGLALPARGLAGTHEVPYFAMEFVAGQPLIEGCRQLTLRERVEVMAKVADAVGYAHEKGVVHRDLKPANVLIVEAHGSTPAEPKVVDFGVAKVTGNDPKLETIGTLQGEIVGTLQYMSPEQARGDERRIDARTDVYALGLLLYEVITGRAPYDVRSLGILEAVQTIQDAEPPLLSTLVPEARGDLELVVIKAMRKECENRYADAREFAADLRRILDERPILARPPSAIYFIKKLVRRHRSLVLGAGVVLSAALITTMIALRARRDSAEAKNRIDANASIVSFQKYVAEIQNAQSAIRSGDFEKARDRLDAAPSEHRDFEWLLLSRQCAADASIRKSSVRKIDREITLEWSHPKSLAYDRSKGLVELIDPEDLRVLASAGEFENETLHHAEFTMDARYLVAAVADSIVVYETATHKLISTRRDLARQSIGWNMPKGGHILRIGGDDGVFRILSIPDLNVLLAHPEEAAIHDVYASHDDATLLITLSSHVMRFRRSSDLTLVSECHDFVDEPHWPVFSADDRRVFALTVSDQKMHMLDVASGRISRQTVILGEWAVVCEVPSGQRILIGGTDGSVWFYPSSPLPDAPWSPLIELRESVGSLPRVMAIVDQRFLIVDCVSQPDFIFDGGTMQRVGGR